MVDRRTSQGAIQFMQDMERAYKLLAAPGLCHGLEDPKKVLLDAFEDVRVQERERLARIIGDDGLQKVKASELTSDPAKAEALRLGGAALLETASQLLVMNMPEEQKEGK